MTSEKTASRLQTTRPRLGLRAVGALVLLAASVGFGGCSLLPGDAPTADPAPAASSKAPDENPATAAAAATGMSEKVQASLEKLAATTKVPNREQMKAALLQAGANQEAIEVSIDVTPTGLAVDAVEAATLVENECVVGQVRDGSVAVSILPALASGRCFVGDVH